MLVIEHYYALKKYFFGGRFNTNELPAAFCKFVYVERRCPGGPFQMRIPL